MTYKGKQNLLGRARSCGAEYGSAKGPRNISMRLRRINGIVPLQGDRLLDIGCGNGAYSIAMASMYNHVDAIDVEPERLAVFKRENNCSNIVIHEMSADDTAFKDETFDAVTAIEIIEHVMDIPKVLKEANRILKKNGWLAITTPNRLWPFEQHGYKIGSKSLPGWSLPGLTWFPFIHKKVSDANAFTLQQLCSYVKDAGLEPLDHRYMFPPLDSLGQGHFFHRIMERLEKTPLRSFAQTLILVAAKP